MNDLLKKKNYKEIMKRLQKPLLLFILGLFLTIKEPGIFLTATNFKSILQAISIYGVMVCGAIFTILLGGIDLSVGATAAISGATCVVTILHFGCTTFAVILGLTAGISSGIIVGIFNGAIVSYFKVPPFLITLATQYIFYGVAQLITKNKVIGIMEPEMFTFIGGGRLFGIPFAIFILITMALISYYVLNYTAFGKKIYAVGGNQTAARYSGIKTKKINISAYAISGFTAAIAGIMLASWNQQAIAKAAFGYENDVLTAIVVGGTSLLGGEGSIQGAMFGALLVGMINNGLRLLGVASTYHSMVKGIIIIIAVSIDAHSRLKDSGYHKQSTLRKIVFFKRNKELAK
jgi:ribose/xylose/arabinose/galactoside ABC-type transport system permease subunit